jgi:hypothetical protein
LIKLVNGSYSHPRIEDDVSKTSKNKKRFHTHTRALPEEKMTSQKHLNINKDFTRALPEEKMISHF